MSLLLTIHTGLSRAGLLISLIIGGWGLLTYFRRSQVTPSYRSTLVMTELLFVAQALVGIGLFVGGRHLRDPLHILYGVLLVIALPLAASYAGSNDQRRQALVFGGVGVFMAGLSIRAVMTS